MGIVGGDAVVCAASVGADRGDAVVAVGISLVGMMRFLVVRGIAMLILARSLRCCHPRKTRRFFCQGPLRSAFGRVSRSGPVSPAPHGHAT